MDEESSARADSTAGIPQSDGLRWSIARRDRHVLAALASLALVCVALLGQASILSLAPSSRWSEYLGLSIPPLAVVAAAVTLAVETGRLRGAVPAVVAGLCALGVLLRWVSAPLLTLSLGSRTPSAVAFALVLVAWGVFVGGLVGVLRTGDSARLRTWRARAALAVILAAVSAVCVLSALFFARQLPASRILFSAGLITLVYYAPFGVTYEAMRVISLRWTPRRTAQ